MRTIFAVVFALAVALPGLSAVSPAWAENSTSSVFPRPVDSWSQWPPRNHGYHQGGSHNHGHFRDHDGRVHGHRGGYVIVAPGRPRVVPGYWAWNGWAWVWVPAHWR